MAHTAQSRIRTTRTWSPPSATLWLVFSFVVLVHVLFIKTFPLNNRGGDTPAYFDLITHFKSNLCLAPGYLFLGGVPFSISPIRNLMTNHPHAGDVAFLLAQHGFDLLCLALLTIVLARTFNRVTAGIALAIAGLSLDGMAVTSSVYPEWLQADLLILSLVFACFGWRSNTFFRKSAWYSLAFTAFTWTYFTKFNALVFAPLIVLPILLEKRTIRARVQLLAIAILCVFVTYTLFVAVYHRPKTGTTDLSYDHSWVLMGRLELIYQQSQLVDVHGPATKRWLALSAALPPSYQLASAQPWFENVHVVDKLGVPYRQMTTYLMNADEAELDRFLSSHPLPQNFKLGVSSIPISLYVGLKESDELGTKVFLEVIRNKPWPFFKDVAKQFFDTLLERPRSHLFPVGADVPTYQQTIVPLDSTNFQLRFEVTPARPYGYDVFRKNDPVIWNPGYKLFGAFYNFAIPNPLLLTLVMLGCVGSALLAYTNGWRFQYAALVALTLNLFGYVLTSSIVAPVRWKEARLALPVVAVIVAITCGYVIPNFVEMVRARKVRRAEKSD